MRIRRMITLALAAVLVGASAVPAFAQTEDKPTGLDRARQVTLQALELAAEDVDEAPPAVPPGQAKDKSDRGKSDEGNAGKGNAAEGNAGKGSAGEGNAGKGNADRVTGRERAAEAIASALERGNGDGNGFGRGHSAEVLEKLLDGESPATLEADANHGSELSAMVKAYNELKKQERTDR